VTEKRAPGPSVTEALDRLYAAPLDGFVALRKELAAGLRAAGDAAGSTEVAAAKKPSRTAWALNQVARTQLALLTAAFDAHAGAAEAQAHGDADAMRETVRGFRDALAAVVRCAAALASRGQVPLGAVQQRQLSETVRAAIGGASRDRLLAGRLTEDVDVDDPFAGAEPGPGRGAAKRQTAAPAPEIEAAAAKARQREADRARERHEQAVEEARGRVDALEGEAREARAAARQAETVARRAEAEAERVRRVVADLEARVEKARAALNDLRERER
jgi:hypothetical protein